MLNSVPLRVPPRRIFDRLCLSAVNSSSGMGTGTGSGTGVSTMP